MIRVGILRYSNARFLWWAISVGWMLFGAGSGPGEKADYHPTEIAKIKGKKATKCDACVGRKAGPACVAACPTGAAMRIGPAQFIDLVEERRR